MLTKKSIEILETGTAFTAKVVDHIKSFVDTVACWLKAIINQVITQGVRVVAEVKMSLIVGDDSNRK